MNNVPVLPQYARDALLTIDYDWFLCVQLDAAAQERDVLTSRINLAPYWAEFIHTTAAHTTSFSERLAFISNYVDYYYAEQPIAVRNERRVELRKQWVTWMLENYSSPTD